MTITLKLHSLEDLVWDGADDEHEEAPEAGDVDDFLGAEDCVYNSAGGFAGVGD